MLISTYELGRQPFGLASPAAWLRKRGHGVVTLDLSRQEADFESVRAAELICIYLPMHTATRLAAHLIPSLRAQNPAAHLCCYGLYAPMNASYLRALGVGTILGGEFEAELVRLAERLGRAEATAPSDGAAVTPGLAPPPSEERPNTAASSNSEISLERLAFEVPDRSGMQAIEKYAHLIIPGDGYRIVGSTEASRGCKHLCRHCPIVPVYNGVFRIVQREVVLEDVRRQVAAGAQHISFGDPDFFNGIRHALELVEAFRREFPAITYDATIKIEHLQKYEQHLATLRETGCLFVISAAESVDDSVLRALEKGHTRADFLQVARKFRELGLTLHPTFVPFTPWTTLEGYLDLLRVLAAEELTENVAPVQLGIRLLIPEGSRMLELEEIRRGVGAFDARSLVYPWKNSDARVDALSEEVQSIAAAAEREKLSRSAAFERVWTAAHRAAGVDLPRLRPAARRPVPFLSEPWYCCAEPTREQFVTLGVAASRPARAAKPAATSADGFV